MREHEFGSAEKSCKSERIAAQIDSRPESNVGFERSKGIKDAYAFITDIYQRFKSSKYRGDRGARKPGIVGFGRVHRLPEDVRQRDSVETEQVGETAAGEGPGQLLHVRDTRGREEYAPTRAAGAGELRHKDGL